MATPSFAGRLEIAHVLFIDVVSYSLLPMDKQEQTLRALQETVRNTDEFVRAHDSDQLISLPTGDGMALVFFNDAEAPAHCAVQLSRALQTQADVKVRMGIHSGPVYRVADINANRNVAGGGINMAQRVMDCGDAGHILVSKSVADVLSHVSTWRKMLYDLGEAEVKHGVMLHIFNLYSDEIGYRELPHKLHTAPKTVVPTAAVPELTADVSPRPAVTPQLYKWLTVALAALLIAGAGVLGWKHYRKAVPVQHAPVSVLVSDFENGTSDPVFDGTLEPALTVALEGAPFITSYSRGQAHKLAAQLQPGTTKLDEQVARLVATREGVNVVIGGTIARDGESYRVTVRALDGVTGKMMATDSEQVEKKDVLVAMGDFAAGIRKALGDTTPQSLQRAAAETFTTGSLDAAHEYAVAQSLHFAGMWNEALDHYSKAAQLDSAMGRAYVGMANCYYNTGQVQQAGKHYQMALANMNRMSEREKYRTRGAYYLLVRDTDKAIEQQLQLVKQYPADDAGLANLALAYFFRRDMQKALEEGRKAVAIYPQNLAQRNNVGLYAMYAGDFETAIKEQKIVLELNPSFVLGYVGTALSQLGEGHPEQAQQTFEKAATLGQQGASAAAAGLADVALYQGRISDAIKILRDGAAADRATKNGDGAAIKLAMLGQAELAKGNTAAASRAADQALELSKEMAVVFWAARTYIATGQTPKALALARQLEQQLGADPQAYGKVIEGEVRMNEHDPRQAIRIFQESRRIADTWMARFDASLAYLDAGAYAQAESELDVCLKRRGEATALFLDESPTYHVFPSVYYYLGRAEEGLKSAAAGESYKTFLDIKQKSEPDPLVSDARHRIGR